MKLFLLLILVSGLNISIAAPAVNVFETYVKTKCPIVEDNVEFFQQPIFNKCSSANVTISSNIEYLKSELNQENENDLLCALFLNKFLTLCDKFQQAPAPDKINLEPDLSNNIFSTCNNLTKVSSIFGKTILCLKFCSDGQGNVLPQCALANYYASYETKSAASVDTGNIDQYNKLKNIQSPVALSGKVPEHIVETDKKTDQSLDDPTNNGKNTDYVINQEFKGPVGTKDRTDGVPTGTKDQTPDIAPTGTKNQPSQTVPTDIKDQTPDTIPTGSQDLTSVKVEQIVPVKKVTLATDTNSNAELLPQDENQPMNQEEVDLDEDKKDFAEQDENNQQLDFDEYTNTEGDEDKPQQDNIKVETKQEKPDKIEEDEEDSRVSNSNIEDIDGESNFFSYFMVVCILFVLGYILYHSRTKVMVLDFEEKRSKR